MEEEFTLKQYGHFSKFEMALMNAEERAWHIKRLNEEFKKTSKSDELPRKT